MWHEARRREKATQKLFSDHKKRAEKRREENKVDPSSLLQLHGIKSKINLDPNTHKLAAKSLVVWQGDKKTTIDRFDVRATLSSLPSAEKSSSSRSTNRHGSGDQPRSGSTILDADENEFIRKLLNYERYRLLIQNDLNKIPETRRLRLVDKSESLSEAKMRKLERNYFGTSGEAVISSDYVATSIGRSHNNNLSHSKNQSVRSQTVAIGYNYNQAPPPQSYGGDVVGYDEVDSLLPSGRTNLADSIIDLDDYDNLDLDCVDKCREGSKKVNEIISKYGLNCDEFNLLIETADDKTNCLSSKEIVRKLKQIRDKDKASKPFAHKPEVSEFYGPTLPPDMKQHDTEQRPVVNEDADDSSSEDDESDRRQRSPRASDLPERGPGEHENSDCDSPSSDQLPTKKGDESPGSQLDLDQIPIPATKRLDRLTHDQEPAKEVAVCEESPKRQTREKDRAPLEPESSVVKADQTKGDIKRHVSPAVSPPDETRRASTPMAYKRYRRSSRSLSRERQLSKRHRFSSDSGSTSSSSSSSSRSSYSSFTSSSSSSRSRSRDGSTSRARERRYKTHSDESPRKRRHSPRVRSQRAQSRKSRRRRSRRRRRRR